LTQPTLLEIFSQLRDHRRAEGKLYPLPQILVFCLLAMLAGATSYRKMHEFIVVHFRRLSLLFPSKMLKAPCYAQIRNIMAGLDPTDMEQAFRLHAEGLSRSEADGLTLLAVDGKALRGSCDALKDKKATQILSVFATDGRIILAHVEIGRVDDWRGGGRSRGELFSGGFHHAGALSIRTVAPFPVAARQTGHADFPHPAFSRPVRPSLSAGRRVAVGR
jgi:hypothetical protein